ncbi:MAG TPA: DUF4328 domain-containing protein [Polyangiaceae bacterium]|jgi:hypothetical protein|nr:DUF4328 domain-containing protein [Polyangiaceae bacterium]
MQQMPHQYPYPPQPGYAPNPYAAPVAAPVAQPSGFGMAVTIMLAIVASYPLLTYVVWPLVPTDAFMTVRMVLLGIKSLLTLIAAIMFLVLLHRAYTTLRARGAALRYTPGMAVGCWFIPFANFVMPCIAVGDAYRAATGKSSGLVVGWWLLYMLSIPLSMLLQMSGPQLVGSGMAQVLNIISPISMLVHIAAFGLWALVARGIANAAH